MAKTLTSLPNGASGLGSGGWRGADLMERKPDLMPGRALPGSMPSAPASARPFLPEVDLLRVLGNAFLSDLPASLLPPGTDVLQLPSPFPVGSAYFCRGFPQPSPSSTALMSE